MEQTHDIASPYSVYREWVWWICSNDNNLIGMKNVRSKPPKSFKTDFIRRLPTSLLERLAYQPNLPVYCRWKTTELVTEYLYSQLLLLARDTVSFWWYGALWCNIKEIHSHIVKSLTWHHENVCFGPSRRNPEKSTPSFLLWYSIFWYSYIKMYTLILKLLSRHHEMLVLSLFVPNF